MKSSKVLILGASGMLGHDLQRTFPDGIFTGHELDITDERAVTTFITKLNPDVVINAAAYTDVDGCEDNQDYACAVNGEALEYLATSCQNSGATLVQYSTDYVFDGFKTEYREDDIPNPINIYGRSKLLGEQNIKRCMDDYRIIRTSWLFGHHGNNFVDTMLRLSGEMESVRVVNDQFGKPTYTADLAHKTREIIYLDPSIYHITNDVICSWYEFASAIIPNATPCSSEEFIRKARRPTYSVLENTKTDPLRPWTDALKGYLEQKEVYS